MGLKVTNNAFGALNAGISNSDTIIVLQAGQGARFPTLGAGDYFYATLIDTSNNLEIVKVTARATDTLTVVRAQDGTTARAYNVNDRFELRPTAALFNEKADADDVTASLATKVNKAGDTMTGNLVTTSEQLAIVRSTGNMARLTLQNTNRNWSVSNYGSQFTPNGNFAIADETAGAVRFAIDTAGRVTMPNQPAFIAGYTSQNFSQSAGVAIMPPFNTTRLNRGSHYSTSTGRFTAPVSGVYAFFACLAQDGGGPFQAYFSAEFYVNGVRAYIGGWGDTDGGYTNVTNQIVVQLNAGDYVEVGRELHQSNIMLGGNATNWYSYFSGYLLG